MDTTFVHGVSLRVPTVSTLRMMHTGRGKAGIPADGRAREAL
jgi:hypothetical protein